MNIQTLPRKDVVVKRAFVPKLDFLLFADYSQIEMRVLAYYMSVLGDKSMADVLNDPTQDLHTESASGIFQIDREPTDPERQLGKNMNFSMVYGGGKPAVMRYLTEFNQAGGDVPVTWKYAQYVLDRFHARWPGISLVNYAIKHAYEQQGFVRTIAGARLHPPSEHKMLNAIVQSGAAEFMRRSMRVCFEELNGFTSHMVCTVHDELVFDCVEDEVAYIIENVTRWMDCFPEVSEHVDITLGIEVSDSNWAEKYEV